jgi:hypothetical protein
MDRIIPRVIHLTHFPPRLISSPPSHPFFTGSLKGGEKPPLKFVPKDGEFKGLTSTTLPDGKSIQIFRQPTSVSRQFAASQGFKHPRSHLNVEKASTIIHSIATRVAKVKPIVIAEPSLRDINSNFISNINTLTAADYRQHASANHIMRIAPPSLLSKGQMYSKKKAKSHNQANRWNNIIKQRTAEIVQKRADFQNHIQTLANYIPIPDDATSTPETPLDFSQDLGLKFRVIDAVINHTKIQVPAHKLGSINNVTELVDFIVEKRNELEAHASIRKNQPRLPENVTFIYADKIDRTKQPKWIKYKELREKNSVATAQ